MGRAIKVPVTPSVLRWAIESSGYSPDEVAAELEVHPSFVSGWLRGEHPSLSHFRALAHLLRRPTAAFLLPNPPQETLAPVQFRPAPGERWRDLLPIEHLRIREAERLQKAFAWLVRQIEDSHPEIPRVRSDATPERAAGAARDFLGVTVQGQVSWRSDSAAHRGWREAFEQAGIIVMHLPMGAQAARGFSVWHDDAPLVAINTHWQASARAFTLLHELGHLLTRTSSICVELGRRRRTAPTADIERWCERFAGAMLLPHDPLLDALKRCGVSGPGQIDDLRVPSRVARTFHASLRATVLRLIDLQLADWALYRTIPRASDAKSDGGGGAGRTRAQITVDEYGVRTAKTFIAGLQKDIIGASDVMRFLDVSYGDLGRLEAITAA